MILTAENRGRVDKLLAEACPQYSRAALAKLFDKGLVKLDGKVVAAGHKVREGATIEADLSPLDDQDQQVIDLPILYEDDDVLVINKPEGVISHARGRYWYEPSVASFVRWKLTGGDASKGVIVPNEKHIPDHLVTRTYPLAQEYSGIDRSGIVHRLDRATSGVMICAKNDASMQYLQKQFAARSVEKTYVAVLEKTPKQHAAIIDAPIERNPKKPSTFRVGPNGKSSQTEYRVLEESGDGRCVVEFRPKTGRTHQLRVHATYIKCPIVGDVLYGTPSDRLYLHAHKLVINLPSSGARTEFVAELPEGFTI